MSLPLLSLFSSTAALLASMQGASAQPTEQPRTGYSPCEYVYTYPARTTHGVVMDHNTPEPILNFIRQEFTHGKAVAQTFYYAKATPHLRVVLGSHGIPPTFLIKTTRGAALAYNIPTGEQWCEIIAQADIHAQSVEVYTKGTQPRTG